MKQISDKNYKAMINNCIDNAVVQLEIIRNILTEEDINYTPLNADKVIEKNELTAYEKVKKECMSKGVWG